MYRHILVPVDGSQTSDLALREATKLVGVGKAELRIVHVVEEVMPLWDLLTSLVAGSSPARSTRIKHLRAYTSRITPTAEGLRDFLSIADFSFDLFMIVSLPLRRVTRSEPLPLLSGSATFCIREG